MELVHKLLPFLLLIAVVLTVIFYLPARRYIAYTLKLTPDSRLSCCDPKVVAQSTGNFDEDASTAIFEGDIIDYPKTSLAQLPMQPADTQVLGTTTPTGEEKWIEVSLDQQKVRAWEGNKLVMEFPISSGRWAPTPEGTFTIWYKTRFQSMIGGNKDLGTYYNLPNVPYNMFFYQGFALHGAYWHNNFGHPMSHGCVNEPLANAKEIFDWAGPTLPDGQNAIKATPENPGTRVVVHKG